MVIFFFFVGPPDVTLSPTPAIIWAYTVARDCLEPMAEHWYYDGVCQGTRALSLFLAS